MFNIKSIFINKSQKYEFKLIKRLIINKYYKN